MVNHMCEPISANRLISCLSGHSRQGGGASWPELAFTDGCAQTIGGIPPNYVSITGAVGLHRCRSLRMREELILARTALFLRSTNTAPDMDGAMRADGSKASAFDM